MDSEWLFQKKVEKLQNRKFYARLTPAFLGVPRVVNQLGESCARISFVTTDVFSFCTLVRRPDVVFRWNKVKKDRTSTGVSGGGWWFKVLLLKQHMPGAVEVSTAPLALLFYQMFYFFYLLESCGWAFFYFLVSTTSWTGTFNFVQLFKDGVGDSFTSHLGVTFIVLWCHNTLGSLISQLWAHFWVL